MHLIVVLHFRVIIDRLALAKQGDNTLGTVRDVCVLHCPLVCLLVVCFFS